MLTFGDGMNRVTQFKEAVDEACSEYEMRGDEGVGTSEILDLLQLLAKALREVV